MVETERARGNLDCLRAGFAEACTQCDLFDHETQRVIDLCDETSAATEFKELKQLQSLLRKRLDDDWIEIHGSNYDLASRLLIIRAFSGSIDREIEILERKASVRNTVKRSIINRNFLLD